ncbi:MAG: alpha/beta hydrolase [Planctomycetes bacterium]|nr:alpha/beta hydrolase [Planctomycetota bacterium]
MAEIGPFVSREVPVQGFRICLWEHVAPGPRVLFLHGFLDTGCSFARVAEQLGNEVHALCLDWRGHGGSHQVPEGMSFHQLDHLKDLAQIVSQEQPELIVAHSMGATIAYLYAAACPGAVRGYVMLDAVGGFRSTPADQADALRKLLKAEAAEKLPFREFADADAAIDRILSNNPGLTRAGAAVMVAGATEATKTGTLRFRFNPRLRGPNPMRYSESTWREMGQRITDPVEVLLGENGLIRKAPILRERAEAMPTANLSIIPEISHHLHLDAPRAIADAIRAML